MPEVSYDLRWHEEDNCWLWDENMLILLWGEKMLISKPNHTLQPLQLCLYLPFFDEGLFYLYISAKVQQYMDVWEKEASLSLCNVPSQRCAYNILRGCHAMSNHLQTSQVSPVPRCRWQWQSARLPPSSILPACLRLGISYYCENVSR